MSSRKLPGVSAFAATIAVSLWAWIPAASSASPAAPEGQARYLPIQSISYEFGSKSMSGYFVQRAETCIVTLMIAEKGDPDKAQPPSPARVRLVLDPGQIAGLDSEEGRSLNLTCGQGAATLLVDIGETGKLVALQGLILPKDIAVNPQ
jgi:hypothetical protein